MANEDPIVRKAIARARRALSVAERDATSDPSDHLGECSEHARAALDHLEAGRWDEARSLADAAVELDELHGDGDRWRDYALLVEEACEAALD